MDIIIALALAVGGIYLIPPFMVVLSYPLYWLDHKGNSIFDYVKALQSGDTL